MGAKRNGRELRAALVGREPVRLQRSLPGADVLNGFVMAVSDGWVLLHRFHDVQLDGWSAVRLDTVRRVERRGSDSLVSRVLRARSQQPTGIGIDLTAARTVISSMADALPLVTFHREALYPDECVIGRPIRFTTKRIHLVDVHTDATWDPEPREREPPMISRLGGGESWVVHSTGVIRNPARLRPRRGPGPRQRPPIPAPASAALGADRPPMSPRTAPDWTPRRPWRPRAATRALAAPATSAAPAAPATRRAPAGRR